FENFVNMRAQLPGIRIDDGKFLLDTEGERVIFGAHSMWRQQSPNKHALSLRANCSRGRCARAGITDAGYNVLSKNVHDHLVKTGDPGSERTTFFEFLHFALAIGRTHHQCVIVDTVGLPIKTPERPGQFWPGLSSFAPSHVFPFSRLNSS